VQVQVQEVHHVLGEAEGVRHGGTPGVEAGHPLAGGGGGEAQVTQQFLLLPCLLLPSWLECLGPSSPGGRLGPDGAAGDGHVEGRLEGGGEVPLVGGEQPLHRQGQPVPGPHPEHAGEHPQLVVEPLLRGFLLRQTVEAAGGGGVLPRPLEPEGGDVVGEAMHHQHHVPGAAVTGAPGASRHLAVVVLENPPVRVRGLSYICPALVLGVGAVEEVDPEELLHLLGALGGPPGHPLRLGDLPRHPGPIQLYYAARCQLVIITWFQWDRS